MSDSVYRHPYQRPPRRRLLLPVLAPSGPVLLEDDFNDNSRDTAKWTLGSIAFENAGVGVDEANQQIEITPLASQGAPALYGYKSLNTYDFTAREAAVRIAADIDPDTEAWLVVAVDADNYLRTWVASGTLQTRSRVAGVNTNESHGSFSFATHTYWRIRHDDDSDEIVWEYSSDGSFWSELRRLARPITITSVSVYLTGGTGSSIPSPGLVKFDDFNLRTPSEDVIVVPATASLTLATFAPSIVQAIRVTPTTASLSLTGFAPSLSERITPSTQSLTLTTFAPALVSGTQVIPGTASLSLTTFAAVLAESTTPITVSLSLSTFAPSVLSELRTTPTTASLTLTSFAPTLVTPVTVTPNTASLILQSFAPKLAESLTPNTGNLTITEFAPSLSSSVTPTTQNLVTATFAPSLQTAITPTFAVLTLTTFAPTVNIEAGVIVVPSTATLTLTTFAPVIGQSVTAVPDPASLVISTFAPSLSLGITPTTLSLTTATFAPSLRAALIPSTTSLTLATFAPTVTEAGADVTAAPGVISLVLTTYAPLIRRFRFHGLENISRENRTILISSQRNQLDISRDNRVR